MPHVGGGQAPQPHRRTRAHAARPQREDRPAEERASHQPSAPGATRGAKIRMRGPDSEHTSGANVDVSVADAEMLQYLDLDEIARAIGMPAGDA
ncbi:hypothetical protein OAO87_04055 [bacterium]|nr:hypothetical protein [bacterium]